MSTGGTLKMSATLDAYAKPTTHFEGQVKAIEFHETEKQDKYMLVYVRGVEKPLALPQTGRYRVPLHGEHVSARDVTEGTVWFWPGHRSVVNIAKPDFELWKKPSKVDAGRKEQAEAIIIGYARLHGEVSADDVADEICDLFPERDPHIVGVFFLGLSKKGLIHRFGEKRTERRNGHGSPLPLWHLTKKALQNV